MKIFTLSTICFILLLNVAAAQKVVPLTFSPKIGVNFNDFIFDDASTPVISLARMGWNLGMDVSYGHRFQVQGGVHFFKLGTGLETETDLGPVTERVATSQFKIPIGASYKIWNVEYFNLWLRTQLVMNLTTKMVHGEAEMESAIYPRSGFGGRVGVGMDLGRFIVEVNYERSFTEMIRQSFDARSKLLNLALGIKI